MTASPRAQDALAALRTTKPAVLVCDIGMPNMDGYQLIRTLRAAEPRANGFRSSPYGVCARRSRKRSLSRAIRPIGEPFDVGELILVIANLIGR